MTMKTKITQLSTIMILLMTSCTSYFYQVYQAVPSGNVKQTDGTLIYEDNNCKILYSFWGEFGDMSFRFYNKTRDNIYLNLAESFFIQNGLAYDYFQNRTYTNTTTSGAATTTGSDASKALTGINYFDLFQTNRLSASSSIGVSASKGYSVGTFEEKVICIPSNSSKIISEFYINETPYRDCILFRYPSNKRQIKTIEFTNENSPLKFSNRLVYFVGKDGDPIKIENMFFVSDITNFPEDELIEYKKEEFCNEKGAGSIKLFKDIAPNKFYIKYSSSYSEFKH